jgi:pullulanase
MTRDNQIRCNYLRLVFAATIFINLQMLESMENNVLVSAKAQDLQTIIVKLAQPSEYLQQDEIEISPDINILSIEGSDHTLRLATQSINLSKEYKIKYKNESVRLLVDPVLDKLFSTKILGCEWDDQFTFFRLFAPRATNVTVVLFKSVQDDVGDNFNMIRDADGVWEIQLAGRHVGKYYAYSVDGPKGQDETFDPKKLVADPYSKAVATTIDYLHRGKSLILGTSTYDWRGDRPLARKVNDLIIYECHIKDLTAHPSAGVDSDVAGSYKGLLQQGVRGGVAHLKSLGVNAVEFLPIQDFGNVEIPYNVLVGDITNTWNPYARNHWGYMTSYFFAPESYYASCQSSSEKEYSGIDGRQVNEFKDVVKALHGEGISVIMDVVYNHVSQYDQNSFKCVDKKYYFHLNEDGSYCASSGCGNDFKTDRKMVRRLILDSIKYWMQEFHVDGFRFDLASMIDWQTCDEVLQEARKLNPDVIFIAEPWGGGDYSPAEFSKHGWAAWNDQIRNGVKGQNPFTNHGFIFGRWFDFNSLETMQRYILGNLEKDGGLFQTSSHSINYLESHDDHTFGDFVRIALGGPEKVVDVDANSKLTEEQLKLNKLGALFLFVSQGAVMMHEGQEWARSKVVAKTDAQDDQVGHIDHNSYNKDNETNWLNFDHADQNAELVSYYKGLIDLRKLHPALRSSDAADFRFLSDSENSFAFAFLLEKTSSGDKNDFFIILNGDRQQSASFKLPDGEWSVLVDAKSAGVHELYKRKGEIRVSPSSGIVLVQ